MLILTRRVSETICIGDDIQITVVGNYLGEVRLGIHAPRSVPVHRQEVYERILGEHGHVMSGAKQPIATCLLDPPHCVGHSVQINDAPEAPSHG